jgi:HAD superfamily hydrolase (TIGR01509 family)
MRQALPVSSAGSDQRQAVAELALAMAGKPGLCGRDCGIEWRGRGDLARRGTDMISILDVDGTIIDSNEAHALSWVDVGAETDHPIDFERARWLIGMGGDKVLPLLTGLRANSREGKRILDRRGEIFRKNYLPQLQPFPMTRELLERMKSEGYELVVASSASEEDLRALLDRAGVRDLISERTSADHADQSKPEPDIVVAALQRAGAKPHDALMLGDTPYDVEAARATGVDIVALRCGGWHDNDLAGARVIYDSPADLLEHFKRSPFARSNMKKS